MNISSDSLFHFTNSATRLINILTSGFQPKYSLETFVFNDTIKEYAIPMVCFCDIPISQIEHHMDIYGQYGLGLSKAWAIRNGLNPVIYLENDSRLNNYTYELSHEIWRTECLNCNNASEKLKAYYWHIIRYVKMYQGDFRHNEKTYHQHCFYNEREWRFIPEVTDLSENSKQNFYLTKDDFINEITREDENRKLKKDILKFTPSDIEYIFVKDKAEVKSMTTLIRNDKKLKGEAFELIPKLLAADQILKDF